MGASPTTAGIGAGLGAAADGQGRCHFLVWAPRRRRVEVHLLPAAGAARAAQRMVPLEPLERGYFAATVDDVLPGALYRYRLDGGDERPDPASRSQPEGVHGPSQVVDPAFPWSDATWKGMALADYVLYELHVGTFTPEGTFDAVIPRLDALRELGVTALELMPVAQFPGARNWGYDGVYPFAAQNSYGGAAGLRRLVDACHARGLGVVLDVVYNHLGPEGNYLAEFGHYFTARARTPWGPAVNFDGAHSDEVRRYFIENALYWVRDCHLDALRLDAVHAIADASPVPFLRELAEAVHAEAGRLGRRVHLMPESDRNDARLVHPPSRGGCGLDALWNDDYHHALHVLLAGERDGYYADFALPPPETGTSHLASALRDGFIYSGQYSAYRQRRQGSVSRGLPRERFVVFAQNHDQVGNRALGERLSSLAGFEALKLAAAAVILSPYLPLLFMGEEYAEPAPFQYFTSHGDPALVEAVRRGRREEFARFRWQGEVPDPQEEATFARSRLTWELRGRGRHAALLAFYKELLRLRREEPALGAARAAETGAGLEAGHRDAPPVVWMHAPAPPAGAAVFAALHFGAAPGEARLPLPRGRWTLLLDSSEARWAGPGAQAPQRVDSAGEAVVRLAPWGAAVYRGAEGGR